MSWLEPRDKGPCLLEREPKHKRKRGKRPFAIEWRYIGPVRWWFQSNREWRVYKRYESERDRDQAIRSLEKKSKTETYGVTKFWEYRKAT